MATTVFCERPREFDGGGQDLNERNIRNEGSFNREMEYEACFEGEPRGFRNNMEKIERNLRKMNDPSESQYASEYCFYSSDQAREVDERMFLQSGDNKLSASEWAEILQHRNDFAVWNGRLYIYIKQFGYWRLVKSSNDNREIRQLFTSDERRYINKNLLREISEWLILDSSPMPDARGESRYYLNLRDCAIDWRKTEDAVVYNRKNMFFRYYLNATRQDINLTSTGAFESFMLDVFGERQKTKQEFCKFLGLCLSDIRDLKIAAFFYGPSNTGKSVMLNLLKKLVGSEFTASVSFSQLGNEFAISRLVGKRLNVSGEVSGTTNKRLDIFKSLTGNDEIEVCNKYEDFAAFANEALLVFACNNFPPVQSVPELESFLARVIIFPFENQKPRNQWIPELESVLMEDAAGILEAAIEGLRQLEEDEFQMKETQPMKEAKIEFVRLYDNFSLFAERYLIENPEKKTASRDISLAYNQFCAEENLMPMAENVWAQRLKQKFYCKSTTLMVDGKRARGFQGVELVIDEKEGSAKNAL